MTDQIELPASKLVTNQRKKYGPVIYTESGRTYRIPLEFAILTTWRRLRAKRLVRRTLAQFVDNPRFVCGAWFGSRPPFRTPTWLRDSRWLQEVIEYGADYWKAMKEVQDYKPSNRPRRYRYSRRGAPPTKGDKLAQARDTAKRHFESQLNLAAGDHLKAIGIHHVSGITHGYDSKSPYSESRKRLRHWPAQRRGYAMRFNEAWSNYRQAKEQAAKLTKGTL